MLPRILGVTLAGFVIASLATSPAAAGVVDRDGRGHAVVHHVRRAHAAHRWHHVAHRFAPAYGNYNTRTKAFIGPGYVFIPGLGILDEDCDMPTSTCPNDVRDIQ